MPGQELDPPGTFPGAVLRHRFHGSCADSVPLYPKAAPSLSVSVMLPVQLGDPGSLLYEFLSQSHKFATALWPPGPDDHHAQLPLEQHKPRTWCLHRDQRQPGRPMAAETA